MFGKAELLKFLDHSGIPFSYEEHDSVLNMAESGNLDLVLEGARCKNLLLQDKKGHYFLIVTTATKCLDLSAAAEAIGSKRLSFVSSDKLFELLGIRTGSLSPLSLVNDEAKRIRLIFDADLNSEPQFLFHPLENSASVLISKQAFYAFLVAIGHDAELIALDDRKVA
jgi:Ala-tRNA(Pro) deacylase